MRRPLLLVAGEDPGCTLRLGQGLPEGCRNGRPTSGMEALLVGAHLRPLSHHACPSEAPASIQPALFPSLQLCPGVLSARWHVYPPVQPRAVAAKRGIASVSYKIFIIIILIIIDSMLWGWGAAQESLWAGSCLRGAGTRVGPRLGAVLQVQWLWGRGARASRVQHQVPDTARDARGEPAPGPCGHVGGSACGRGEDKICQLQGPKGQEGMCCSSVGAPFLCRGLSPGLTDVDAALGIDRHIRAWGLAADQLLTIHLDGTSPALSVVGRTGSGPSPPILHAP